MHRSGTSLVAKSFEVFGYGLGETLMAPSDDNPKGFFEDLSSRRFGPRIESSGYRCFSPLFLLFGGEDKVGMRINRNTYAVD